MTDTQVPQDAYKAAELPAWRRRLPLVVIVVVLIASAGVLATTPQVTSSQEAMGQGLPSTSFGTVAVGALAVGFVPDGFVLASEEADGGDRVTQRYRSDDGGSVRVILITTVVGGFDPAATLAANPDAEEIAVGGQTGVLQRLANPETGEPDVVVRVQVGDDRNVIVRGVGGVAPEELVAVAAAVSAQAS